ncbi:hypothetical protein D3C80_1404380 [compost metagenome]
MGKGLLLLVAEVRGMVGNSDNAKTGGDSGLYIIPDGSVCMAAAEMMGVQVELHMCGHLLWP